VSGDDVRFVLVDGVEVATATIFCSLAVASRRR
jgi:hypothetical protein